MTTATMSSTAPLELSTSPRPAAGFSNTLASEWIKVATLRSTYFTLGLGFVLSVATTALVALALGSTQESWAADFSPITTSMVGNIWALIVFSVFGVMVVSREYSSGTIRLTLTATPRRGRVLLAKLILASTIITVMGVLTTVTMFLVGQAILGAYGMPVADFGDADARRMVLGLGATMAFFPVIGLAFGVIFRSTAGAITTVLGFQWLPVVFGELLPLWWKEHIISFLPGNGLDSVTIGSVEPSPAFSDPLTGAAIAASWFAVIVGVAFVTFVRRDA